MNKSENLNLTETALFRAPIQAGRIVAYLGAVHAVGATDGRIYKQLNFLNRSIAIVLFPILALFPTNSVGDKEKR